jgi:predicted transcriptional regulator
MNDQELLSEELLDFFKAMADANRQKIMGLLAQENLSVGQLAEMLKLRPSTVSHHLSKLTDAGLVSAKASSYYNIYQLENSKLESMAQRLLSSDTLPAMAAGVDLDSYDRKVIAMAAGVDLDSYDRKVISDYSLPDGQLKTIPAQRKKLDAVLRYVVRSFEFGTRYTEQQVNEILGKFHEDTATLRRELIGAGLLARSTGGREYWRVEDHS